MDSTRFRAPRPLPVALLVATFTLLLAAPGARAQDDDVESAEGPVYPISAMHLEYIRENPLHPDLDEVMQLRIPLARISSGYIAPRPRATAVALSQLGSGMADTGADSSPASKRTRGMKHPFAAFMVPPCSHRRI